MVVFHERVNRWEYQLIHKVCSANLDFSVNNFSILCDFNSQTPVYVYYESLCPDSQAFITKQLYPSMKILKDHIDLHLVPFGKSTVSVCSSLQCSSD